MFAMLFMLYCCTLLMSKVLTEPPQPSIFDKFQQNDFKIKFEHIDLDHYNKNIFKELKIVSFKYNRTSTACNVTAELKIDLNTDMEVIVQVYKLASNEYRLFPLRFQVNACRAVTKDLVGIANFSKCGNFSGCPLKKGRRLHFCNWCPDETKYPPFIPSGRYMLDAQMLYGSTEVALVKAYTEIYVPIPIPD